MTLSFAYVHDNSDNNTSIASIKYVSNSIPIGFSIKAHFNELLDSFCKVCPTAVVWKIQLKTIETQCSEHITWLVIIIVPVNKRSLENNSRFNVHV